MKPISLNQTTQKDFLVAVNDSKPTLILCYANWCGWCNRFKPTWDKIKRTLSRNGDVHVVEVEYDDMQLLPKNLQNVRGFPMIQIIKKGKVHKEYQGDRNHDDIVTFAMSQVVKKRPASASVPKTRSTLKKKEVKTV